MASAPAQLDNMIARLQALKDISAHDGKFWQDKTVQDRLERCTVTLSSLEGAVQEENKKLDRDAIATDYRPGQYIDSKGVFIGAREIRHKGELLGAFNVFADRRDVPHDFSNANSFRLETEYNKLVTELKYAPAIEGHKVKVFNGEEELNAALANGTYDGEYFVPTVTLAKEHLFRFKDSGMLKGSFGDAHGYELTNHVDTYWTCSAYDERQNYAVTLAERYGGVTHYPTKDDGSQNRGLAPYEDHEFYTLSTRLVRLEKIPAPR